MRPLGRKRSAPAAGGRLWEGGGTAAGNGRPAPEVRAHGPPASHPAPTPPAHAGCVRVRLVVRLLLATLPAGALLAALLLPMLLGPGLALDRFSAHLTDVPLAQVEQPLLGNTRILAADGSLITEFYDRDRFPVTGDKIALVMKQAMVDIEDARFYEHGALDLRGTVRALVSDLVAHRDAQGGSTLTQQLVKQTLLQNATTQAQARAAVADTLDRKLGEARLAAELEDRLSKDQILTRYLNTVYFGDGAYGVQAAAHNYFSTDAAHLSLAQAATLAGLVQD